jgi:hypothetical protein
MLDLSIQGLCVLFVQEGLYLEVEAHKMNNFMRGAWKRSLQTYGKIRCRYVGCNFESETVEEALEHYLNCAMAPKKVSITQCNCVRC